MTATTPNGLVHIRAHMQRILHAASSGVHSEAWADIATLMSMHERRHVIHAPAVAVWATTAWTCYLLFCTIAIAMFNALLVRTSVAMAVAAAACISVPPVVITCMLYVQCIPVFRRWNAHTLRRVSLVGCMGCGGALLACTCAMFSCLNSDANVAIRLPVTGLYVWFGCSCMLASAMTTALGWMSMSMAGEWTVYRRVKPCVHLEVVAQGLTDAMHSGMHMAVAIIMLCISDDRVFTVTANLVTRVFVLMIVAAHVAGCAVPAVGVWSATWGTSSKTRVQSMMRARATSAFLVGLGASGVLVMCMLHQTHAHVDSRAASTAWTAAFAFGIIQDCVAVAGLMAASRTP